MAKQTIQSGLLAKLGNRLAQAFEAHKTDETEYGQIELPPGIENGIVLLDKCGFGTYKNGDMQGEIFFRASGVVLRPKLFTDAQGRKHRTEGQHASIGPEPLCDTPKRATRKTLDDHIAWILNELRKMGVKTDSISWDQLEAVCAALVQPESPVYVKFRTWRGEATPEFPNPRTNVQFVGPADPSELEEAEGGDDDVQEAPAGALPAPPTAPPRLPVPQKNGHQAPPPRTGPVQHGKTPGAAAPAPAAPGKKPAPTPGPTPGKRLAAAPPPPKVEEPAPNEGSGVDELVELAMNDDEAAKNTLADMAVAQGFTEEQVANAPSWADLGEAMKSGEEPSSFEWGPDAGAEDQSAPAEGGANEWQPEVDQIYMYRPINPRTKQPADKAVEVTVAAVDADGRTVDLKNNANARLVYKKVSWDSLESGEPY